MDMAPRSPLICALDTTELNVARKLACELQHEVGAIKLGLEFFTAHGAAGVNKVADKGLPLFLDLKFHDIPNTVAGAIRATADIHCFMTTIHIGGGIAMMKAAVDASMWVAETTGQSRPMIIGVTMLTSLDQDDLQLLGYKEQLPDQVARMAQLAQDCRLDGIVCSPYEITALRKQCGKDFLLVVPGIRPEGTSTDDQKRVMRPKEAIERGADYLVIGRPITQAPDPAQAAREITQSL